MALFFTAPKLLDYADQIIDSCRLGRSDKLPNIISIIRKIVQTHDLSSPSQIRSFNRRLLSVTKSLGIELTKQSLVLRGKTFPQVKVYGDLQLFEGWFQLLERLSRFKGTR